MAFIVTYMIKKFPAFMEPIASLQYSPNPTNEP
jgi:hypothetical protein